MYAMLPELRKVKNAEEMDAAVGRIERYEQLTDRMDMELTKFLVTVGGAGISDNLESIGDSILQIALTRKNKYADAVHFSDKQNARLTEMSDLVEKALQVMDANIAEYDRTDQVTEDGMKAAEEAEREVNACRDRLRANHIEALKKGQYGYEIGNAYSSLYAQYEKLADFVINVSEAAVCQDS